MYRFKDLNRMTNTATVHRRSNFKAQEVGFQRKRGTLMVSQLEYICISVATSKQISDLSKRLFDKKCLCPKTHDRYPEAVQILMHNSDIQKKHPYCLWRTLTSGFRACARGEFSHPDLCLQGEFFLDFGKKIFARWKLKCILKLKMAICCSQGKGMLCQ